MTNYRRCGCRLGSLQTALDKVAAALGSVGDAGQQARQVVDELRASLQAAAVQGMKSAAALPNLMRSTVCPPRAAEKTAATAKEKQAAQAGRQSGKIHRRHHGGQHPPQR